MRELLARPAPTRRQLTALLPTPRSPRRAQVATLDDPAVGTALAVAIAVHNIPEGMCVAVPLYYSTGSKWKGFWLALFSGVT